MKNPQGSPPFRNVLIFVFCPYFLGICCLFHLFFFPRIFVVSGLVGAAAVAAAADFGPWPPRMISQS